MLMCILFQTRLNGLAIVSIHGDLDIQIDGVNDEKKRKLRVYNIICDS